MKRNFEKNIGQMIYEIYFRNYQIKKKLKSNNFTLLKTARNFRVG